ncbi:hypothetical protein FRC10_001720 [Ceratobasidium sp. 414]|nr:hypothetical protein FRC10_001720 [Ceratobasidium sp. 414]
MPDNEQNLRRRAEEAETSEARIKHQLLIRELENKDQIINSLLRQLHNPAMRTPISLPNVPTPQKTPNTPERPPDKDVLAWIESIRQNRPPSPTGAVYAGATDHQSESPSFIPYPPYPFDPYDDAMSFGESMLNRTNDGSGSHPYTPNDLRQSSAELGDTLHSIPPSTAPVGFIADLALSTNRTRRGSEVSLKNEVEEEDHCVGVGNMAYFEAGPSADPELRRMIIERQMPPEILTNGIIKPAEVEILFRIYFEKLNPFVAILDPSMHTPAFVFGRCPFLFTVICAISSRYHRERPERYTVAMDFTKQLAAKALVGGWKSIELVQAYTLMSAYPVPTRRWNEDRTGWYLSLAIKIATDLNLHVPWQGKLTSEAQEREALNRTRTWLVCFYLTLLLIVYGTGTSLAQHRSDARPLSEKVASFSNRMIGTNAARTSEPVIFQGGDHNLMFGSLRTDVHLLAYTRILWVVARFLTKVLSNSGSPTALNKRLDLLSVAGESDKELIAFERETQEQFETESDHDGTFFFTSTCEADFDWPVDPVCEYRRNWLPFLSNYSRLVIFSFVYQEAFQGRLQHAKVFFDMCYKAASEVVKIAIEVLTPTAFLLKMLQPQFAVFLEPEQSVQIVQLAIPLTTTLASDKVAVDNRHCPCLHSRFLSGLIDKLAQNGLVLERPLEAIPTDTMRAGMVAPSNLKPKQGNSSQSGAINKAVSETGATRHTSTSATDASVMQESQRTSPESEAAELRHQLPSLPGQTIIPSMGFCIPNTDSSIQGGDQIGSVDDHLKPVPSATGILTTQNATRSEGEVPGEGDGNVGFEDTHDMLASMSALADQSWFGNCLLPGFNVNFPDDVSNSSGAALQGNDVNSESIFLSVSPGKEGTASEVVACLTNRGCINITDLLDENSCSNYPISSGGFGDIYRGMLDSGTQVAIKTMRLRAVSCGTDNQKSLKYAARELYTWSKCQHRNVQRLLGLIEFRGQIGMVSKWEINGNLSDYIQRQPEADRVQLSIQLAEGLSYLHGAGVVHGDLKASNVLISGEGIPLLSDFGNATLQEYTLKFTTTSTKNAISYRWASPELLEGTKICSAAADVYALGMETITGRLPWWGMIEAAVAIAVTLKKTHPERPKDHIKEGSQHGEALWSLLKWCWAFNPEDRPSAAQAKERMQGISYEGLSIK